MARLVKKSAVLSIQYTDHKCTIAMAKINEFKFELLQDASYSPALAPRIIFCVGNREKWVGGKRFASTEELVFTVDGYFQELGNLPVNRVSKLLKTAEKNFVNLFSLLGCLGTVLVHVYMCSSKF